MYSVVILTYNEVVNIGECLNSIKHSNDIVILDSYSTDNTLTIADKYRVRVYRRKFDNYASQRNYALNEIEYKNRWLLMLDADERLTEDFEQELLSELNGISGKVSLIRFRRKDFLLGKWLKRSSGYPTWFGRILKIGSVRIEREINEEYHTEGDVKFLKEHILHFPFNKGLEYWIERHNKYSSMEAGYLTSNLADTRISVINLLSKDPVIRRRILKQIFYKLPFRSSLVFLYLYIFRLGFLDGYPGYLFCRLRSIYEYMIVIKMKEHLNKN
ncbi:MAG: glycosyltransferase family 2 protein [Ignavibacteria bacterium]|nr:glycosyltransferase family 2 protein [Ignavibacteria bacterium]